MLQLPHSEFSHCVLFSCFKLIFSKQTPLKLPFKLHRLFQWESPRLRCIPWEVEIPCHLAGFWNHSLGAPGNSGLCLQGSQGTKGTLEPAQGRSGNAALAGEGTASQSMPAKPSCIPGHPSESQLSPPPSVLLSFPTSTNSQRGLDSRGRRAVVFVPGAALAWSSVFLGREEPRLPSCPLMLP